MSWLCPLCAHLPFEMDQGRNLDHQCHPDHFIRPMKNKWGLPWHWEIPSSTKWRGVPNLTQNSFSFQWPKWRNKWTNGSTPKYFQDWRWNISPVGHGWSLCYGDDWPFFCLSFFVIFFFFLVGLKKKCSFSEIKSFQKLFFPYFYFFLFWRVRNLGTLSMYLHTQ